MPRNHSQRPAAEALDVRKRFLTCSELPILTLQHIGHGSTARRIVGHLNVLMHPFSGLRRRITIESLYPVEVIKEVAKQL